MKIGSKFRVSALIVLLSVLAELSYSTGGYYASLLPIGFGIVLYFVIKELSDMNVSRNIITLRAEVQNNVYVTHVNEDTEVKEERFGRNGHEPSVHLAAIHIYGKAVNDGSYRFSNTVSGIVESNGIVTVRDILDEPPKKKVRTLVVLSPIERARLKAVLCRYSRENATLLFKICSGNLRCEYAASN